MADEQANAYYNSGHSSQGSRRRSRRHRDDPDRLVENLGGYKIRIPPFHGNNNPDEYMDWEKKCEFNFNLHNISNINRVKLAVSEFNDYALRWWEQVVTAREIGGALEVSTWEEMTRIMRQRQRGHYVSVHWRIKPRDPRCGGDAKLCGLRVYAPQGRPCEQQLKRKTPSRFGADQRRPMNPRDSRPAFTPKPEPRGGVVSTILEVVLEIPFHWISGTMVSEKEDEEDSNKSLSESLLDQIKKLMREEFEWREQVKAGKRKESRDHIHISDEERRNDAMTSRRMADEQANSYYNSGHSSQGSRRCSRRHRDDPDRLVENLGGYKIRIPPFHGNNNPDEYMDWEKKCEFNFNLHNISNINRVKLAVSEFNDYALRWWEQVVTAREIGGALEVSTWEEMTRIMRQRQRGHYVSVHWRIKPRDPRCGGDAKLCGLRVYAPQGRPCEQQLKRKTPSRFGADQRRPMNPRDSRPAFTPKPEPRGGVVSTILEVVLEIPFHWISGIAIQSILIYLFPSIHSSFHHLTPFRQVL
ncbi:unnamed protein product [Microthlaspi erraticum]|uniref:Retrotransposon gag domain-containing protein n=1 Tax=Microthlaspi erraticum TaxID=1685480 RepID=A0A6D2J8H9_9BRAS|nr:unnamed protein product [Microthlaspi erraticum]